jgi:8-oxo-dGTP pyrophosphatase MutT (NUDIX family)
MSLEIVVLRLGAHAKRVTDPTEATMLAGYGPFIAAHPDCLWRTCREGHLTASAWIVDAARTRTLLTHHRKLDRWFQLGGHVDGEADLAVAALREAREESGLTRLRLVTPEIFDVDRHRIPVRGNEPEHWHYDVRFLIEADPAEPLGISEESKALAWVRLEDVAGLNPSESLARMVRKIRLRQGYSATSG